MIFHCHERLAVLSKSEFSHLKNVTPYPQRVNRTEKIRILDEQLLVPELIYLLNDTILILTEIFLLYCCTFCHKLVNYDFAQLWEFLMSFLSGSVQF